jgi:hypothetical protein
VIHLQFATRRFVEHLSLDQPLLLVFEDIHWADDVLLDLMSTWSRTCRNTGSSSWPGEAEFLESRPNWGRDGRGTTLPLDPDGHRSGGGDRSLLATRRRPPWTRGRDGRWQPVVHRGAGGFSADDPLSRLPGTVLAASPHGSTRCRPAADRAPARRDRATFWRDVLATCGELSDVDEALESLEARVWCSAGRRVRSRAMPSRVQARADPRRRVWDAPARIAAQAARRDGRHLERSVPDPESSDGSWPTTGARREPSRRSRTCCRRPGGRRTPSRSRSVGALHAGARPGGLGRRAARDPVAAWSGDGSSRTTRAPSASWASWCRALRTCADRGALAQGRSAVWTRTWTGPRHFGTGRGARGRQRRPGASAGRLAL